MRYIVRILLLSIFSTLFMFSNAQEDVKLTAKEQRKAEKAKIKKEKEEKQAANWLVYQKIAADQQFVVQINRVGNRVMTERLNFIYFNKDQVVIQIETNQYFAENGLGGMTIDGIPNNYKYTPPKNDKKPIFINFDVTSKFRPGVLNISITITEDGLATIAFGSASAIYGTFLPIEGANINMGVDMRN